MSTIIKFDLKELKKLANDKNSCVVEKKVTQKIALQPWCLGNIKESIKNLLDYKIGKFDKDFNGIMLSYKNLRVLQNFGTIRNDNSEIQFQVQADYFVFCPYVGATLTGIVNKKSITHLAVLVHRVFNVVIPRPTEEPGNKWLGSGVQEGQEVTFKIVVLDLFGALPYIRGELDESTLNLDGVDIEVETKTPSVINVSYVDFDKTKPFYTYKQSGDGPPSSTLRNTSQEKTLPVTNGKCSTKTGKSNTSLTEKTKKRQKVEKVSDVEVKQTESSVKSSKKHRRES